MIRAKISMNRFVKVIKSYGCGVTLACFISARRRFCTPPVKPSITNAKRMNITPRVDESAAAAFYHDTYRM